jgi:hypothetical protein
MTSYCTHTTVLHTVPIRSRPEMHHAVLILYSYHCTSYCTHKVKAGDAPCCTHTVLILYSYCTHAVLMLYSYCTHTTVLILYPYKVKAGDAPALGWEQRVQIVTCLARALVYLHSLTPGKVLNTVLLLYFYCTDTVLMLYSHCTHDVLILYSYCFCWCTYTL